MELQGEKSVHIKRLQTLIREIGWILPLYEFYEEFCTEEATLELDKDNNIILHGVLCNFNELDLDELYIRMAYNGKL